MTNQIAQIIVVTHGDLACALLKTVESIAGLQPDLSCVGLSSGEDVQAFRSRLVLSLKPNQSALILVDMPGGTPWNVASSIALSAPLMRVVSGVNLSMLLEVALTRRGLEIDQLAQLAHQAGIDAITIARNEVRQ
jgi:PTS system mannose-specific IIA component